MNFSNFLICDGYQKAEQKRHQTVYKVGLDGQQHFNLGVAIPAIESRRGRCIGLATPFEVSMSGEVTVVFFTLTVNTGAVDEKMCKHLFNYYLIATGAGVAERGYRPSPSAGGGMSGAMTLDSNGRRSIARGINSDIDDDDDEDESLYDMMKRDGFSGF